MGTNQLLEGLQKLSGSKTLIIGIGNSLKGDDGVGPAVCERLQNLRICAEVIDTATAPENFIQKIIQKREALSATQKMEIHLFLAVI